MLSNLKTLLIHCAFVLRHSGIALTPFLWFVFQTAFSTFYFAGNAVRVANPITDD